MAKNAYIGVSTIVYESTFVYDTGVHGFTFQDIADNPIWNDSNPNNGWTDLGFGIRGFKCTVIIDGEIHSGVSASWSEDNAFLNLSMHHGDGPLQIEMEYGYTPTIPNTSDVLDTSIPHTIKIYIGEHESIARKIPKMYVGVPHMTVYCDSVGEKYDNGYEVEYYFEGATFSSAKPGSGYTIVLNGVVYQDCTYSYFDGASIANGATFEPPSGEFNVQVNDMYSCSIYDTDGRFADYSTLSLKIYTGSPDGVARKIVKGYIGDENGIARLCYSAVTLISFTIEGTTYQAEEGMTFGEWVESDYNVVGYKTDGEYIMDPDGYLNVQMEVFGVYNDVRIYITLNDGDEYYHGSD